MSFDAKVYIYFLVDVGKLTDTDDIFICGQGIAPATYLGGIDWYVVSDVSPTSLLNELILKGDSTGL